jgi:hypothetical protein
MDDTVVYLPSRRLSLAVYYTEQQIKEAVIGGTYSTYGVKEKCVLVFGG